MAYEVNYDDKVFTDIEADKNAALEDVENTYQGMIDESNQYYQAQIEATKDWGDKQTQLQQEQTDFTIEQINQQKEQAQKDYQKEQSAAYVDWQKQSNDYGSNAEKMADAGLAHSGYSESSKVAMWNTYQNRIATARETVSKAMLNYDNAIKDAQLKNNAVLADIAYQTLQTTLSLSLEGFQYNNSLLLDMMNKKTETEQIYYGRYQDALAQLNYENSMAEQIRQFNASLAEDQRQFNLSYNGGSGGSSNSKKSSPSTVKGGASNSKKSSPSPVKGGAKGDKKGGKTVLRQVKDLATIKDIKTYGAAKKFLSDNGKDGFGEELVTEMNWQIRKNSGDKGEPYQHSTYQDYLRTYLLWAIDNK
jgi:hypothetical protein